MNQWPGVKLRVTEGYDEEGFHSADSLHYEGRAVDITTSDRDISKYGMLARLAVEAGFDWVFYESRSHVHCSVKSESADAARSGGCFSGESFVQTTQGVRKMSELLVGDQVLVTKSDGSLHFSKVIMFLDRDTSQKRLYTNIVTESGAKIILTPSHLIFISNDKRTNDIRHGTAIFAKNVELGHYIFVKSNTTNNELYNDGKVVLEKVVSISVTTEVGVFAPLTREGNLVVNNVVASCYAVLNHQTLAHWAFLPVRIVDNLMQASFHFLRKFHFVQLTEHTPKSINKQPKGIHWYPRLLYKMSHYLFSERYLYS
ncbi:sonic hedgehog protein A-like [Stegodyphus dumicola]|uniref:sonic hedgehog protein A-like n=1 Tax=Stegodyphus dumicola TaxID=202533 RepID=UPI0015AD1765|nr:sonic hedgehog protein A-like [Stegodyphus dumicola]